MTPTSELKIVMGAMTFGEEGKEDVRVHSLRDVEAILDVFQKHGHEEVDTAGIYTEGTSEQCLGKIDWQKRGLVVETKVYPLNELSQTMHNVYKHTPEGIKTGLEGSLKALKTDKLELFYLHAPDRTVPWEITFKALDDLHKEGKFSKLGLSNYQSWEVAEIVTLCRANGWLQPTIYQGLYNAIHRAAELELFPCLRKFGISFYAFNPLGGGFFTGRYTDLDSIPEPGARFDQSKGTAQSMGYRAWYWNEKYFKALDIIKTAAEKEGLTLAESALRYLSHHSILKKEFGDAVIVGASSLNHIEQNLLDLEKGPLPGSVVKAIDAAWDVVKGDARTYWH